MSNTQRRHYSAARCRSRRSKFRRRREIERVAFREFAKKGYAATRTDDIAAKAGISKGTVYLYFDSKEALFVSALKGVLDREVGALARCTEATGLAPSAFLRGPFTEMLRGFGYSDAAAAFRLLIADGGNRSGLEGARLRQVLTPVFEALRRLIGRGIANGEFKGGALEQVPELLFAPAALALLPGRDARWSDDLVNAHVELMLMALQLDTENSAPRSRGPSLRR